MDNNTDIEKTEEKPLSMRVLKKTLDTQLGELKSKKKTVKRWTLIWIAIICITLYERLFFAEQASVWQSILSISFLVIGLLGLIVQSTNTDKNRKEQTDIDYRLSMIEDDIFLDEIKGLNYEEKALKQLTKKQLDLDRYHALTYSHTKSIFVIGVVIIGIGILTILATLFFVFIKPDAIQPILIIAGFAGGVLIDGVGAIFIVMYTKTNESASSYQSGMVETANTYLGNVLSSQIQDEKLRESTLSEMAKELVKVHRHK